MLVIKKVGDYNCKGSQLSFDGLESRTNSLFIYLFIYGCVGFSFLCEGFLQLRRAGATLHRGARAFHHRGLSCCGAHAPDAQAQQLWLTGLVAPRHVGSSQTRARTRVPCISRQILNHCATSEAPNSLFSCDVSLALRKIQQVAFLGHPFLVNQSQQQANVGPRSKRGNCHFRRLFWVPPLVVQGKLFQVSGPYFPQLQINTLLKNLFLKTLSRHYWNRKYFVLNCYMSTKYPHTVIICNV